MAFSFAVSSSLFAVGFSVFLRMRACGLFSLSTWHQHYPALCRNLPKKSFFMYIIPFFFVAIFILPSSSSYFLCWEDKNRPSVILIHWMWRECDHMDVIRNRQIFTCYGAFSGENEQKLKTQFAWAEEIFGLKWFLSIFSLFINTAETMQKLAISDLYVASHNIILPTPLFTMHGKKNAQTFTGNINCYGTR